MKDIANPSFADGRRLNRPKGVEVLKELMITDSGIVERDKVQEAINRLKSFEPPEGYYLAFSGGKDSVVLKALADMSGVKYDAHYSLTTVDPPELVRFIKDKHPDVEIVRPKETMWQLIVSNGVPTRIQRFCCKKLKEACGIGRITLTGVRWAESVNRKNNRHLVDVGRKNEIVHNDDNDEARRTVEQCYRTKKTLVNPIIDWLDDDVWEFIHMHHVAYCCLYDDGFKRIGCIGCPMNTNSAKEFERYPVYKQNYIKAFQRMIDKRKESGNPVSWSDGLECFNWWISKSSEKPIDGQTELDLSDA